METTERRSFLRTRCVPRLFRSFMNFFVGETRWQELQNSLPPQVRQRYHRFNIEFFGDEPELDDVQFMPNMRQQAKTQALLNNDIQNCSDNLLSALFYLELTAVPTFDRTLFTCRGRILCRIGPSHPALRALARRLKVAHAHFYLGGEQKFPCVDEESYMLLEMGGPFQRAVTFKVASLQDFVDIKVDGIKVDIGDGIKGVKRRARSISNCPYKVETLIKDECLDCVFGSRRGRKRQHPQMTQVTKRAKFRHTQRLRL
jgi:hypothetical protein